MSEDRRGHVSTGSRAPHGRRPCGLSCGGAGVEGRTAVSRLRGRFRKRFDFIVDPDRAAGERNDGVYSERARNVPHDDKV